MVHPDQRKDRWTNTPGAVLRRGSEVCAVRAELCVVDETSVTIPAILSLSESLTTCPEG